LWVEARLCFAKQMIFERNVYKAVLVLRDITAIIPPIE